MNDLIRYLAESGVSLVMLFAVYYLLLRRETYFGMIRSFLLGSILFSFIVPFIQIYNAATPLSIPAFTLEGVTVDQGILSPAPATVNILSIVFFLYLSVSALLLVRLVANLWRIMRLIRTNTVRKHKQYRLVLLQQNLSPFSFFSYIFINKQYTQDQIGEIIEHERAHIRQLHSLDIILSELLVILQWFNPVAWMYRKTLGENHEFLADRSVLRRGYTLESYQLSILSQLFATRTVPVTNNFNKSITSKRINMMKKTRSSRLSKLKLLAAIPAAGLLFTAIACSNQEDGPLGGDQQEAEYISEQPGESLVYYQPEEMAVYPGGFEAFRKYIAENLIYPEEAAKNKIEGKVVVQFVVDEQGKVIPVTADRSDGIPPPPPVEIREDDPRIKATEFTGIVVVATYAIDGSEKQLTREESSLLEEEAIRVIKSVPPFEKPAMVDGKPVKVRFTFPITFRLDQ